MWKSPHDRGKRLMEKRKMAFCLEKKQMLPACIIFKIRKTLCLMFCPACVVPFRVPIPLF